MRAANFFQLHTRRMYIHRSARANGDLFSPWSGYDVFRVWVYVCLWGLALSVVSCRTRSGDFSGSIPPSTKLFLDTISLPDSLSKFSKVALYWSGESQNGYLRGFEIATDSLPCSTDPAYLDRLSWSFTTLNDSLFLFPVKHNQEFGKVSFYARAVDDQGVRDPQPPCLVMPVRNSRPTIAYDRLPTDTVHLVASLGWSTQDADGEENMDSVYIKINEGAWTAFPKSVNYLTLAPLQAQDSLPEIEYLTGLDGLSTGLRATGLVSGITNRVYVRVKDISNALSLPDTVEFVYKNQKSDFLYVDAYAGDAEKVIYTAAMASAQIGSYDYYDMYRDGGNYFPQNWNLTFTRYISYYKKIFWVTDNANPSGLSLENGAFAIQKFLENGGKIWSVASKLPSNRESPIYQYLPIDSVSKDLGQARMNTGTLMVPTSAIATDTLASTTLLLNVSTLYAFKNQTLYSTPGILKLSGWSGPETLAAYGTDNSGNINRVVFGVDLHLFNGRAGALSGVFGSILKDQFDK